VNVDPKSEEHAAGKSLVDVSDQENAAIEAVGRNKCRMSYRCFGRAVS
jgi:hypothetical protein